MFDKRSGGVCISTSKRGGVVFRGSSSDHHAVSRPVAEREKPPAHITTGRGARQQGGSDGWVCHLRLRPGAELGPLRVMSAVFSGTCSSATFLASAALEAGGTWRCNLCCRSEPRAAPPVVAKRQNWWAAFSASVDRFLKETRTFRGENESVEALRMPPMSPCACFG